MKLPVDQPPTPTAISRTIIITIIISLFITPLLSLKCLTCEPCNDQGVSVTCRSNEQNCRILFGYKDNFVGVSKSCSSDNANNLASVFCQSSATTTLQNITFINGTGCLCGSDDCNVGTPPAGFSYTNTPKYAEEMAGNLRCLQCDPCTGPGIEVLCPDGTINCFEHIDFNRENRTLRKGCGDVRLGRPKALNKVCKKLKAKSSPPDSSPIVRAECLCSTNNCDTRVPSDPLPVILRPMCYQCTGNCTGLGDLKQCEDPSFNCFVTHDTATNTSQKGCKSLATHNYPYPQKKCTTTGTQTTCICSDDGCNKYPGLRDVALSCYQCGPCGEGSIGTLAECPTGTVNCVTARGYNPSGVLETLRACYNDSVGVVLAGRHCKSIMRETYKGVTYVNVTACFCASEGCNYKNETKVIPVDGGKGKGGKGDGSVDINNKSDGRLRCYECYDCKNVGKVVTCPAGTLNCYYGEGISETGMQIKVKGCVGSEVGLNSPLDQRQCLIYNNYTLNGTTFTNVKVCGCGMNLCNDELKNQGLLECYECDQCRGRERLVTCANGTKNCFVLTGLVGLFKVRAKGCLMNDSVPILSQPVCTRYDRRRISNENVRNAVACACSTSKCNNRDILEGASFNENAATHVLPSKLVALAVASVAAVAVLMGGGVFV